MDIITSRTHRHTYISPWKKPQRSIVTVLSVEPGLHSRYRLAIIGPWQVKEGARKQAAAATASSAHEAALVT